MNAQLTPNERQLAQFSAAWYKLYSENKTNE